MKKRLLNQLYNWVENSLNHILPPWPSFFYSFLEKHKIVENLIINSPFLRAEPDFSLNEIPPRTALFIQQAREHGFKFRAYKSSFGFVNYFRMEKEGKFFLLEGLPRAEFLSGKRYQFVDDKSKVKKILKENDFPVAGGQSFWFFQKQKAREFALKLGFPVVVKPRSGSLSKQVFTDIRNPSQLNSAIDRVLEISPTFLIEDFLENTSDYRVTVVDFEKVFCFQRQAASVIGDGKHTIKELIAIKNSHPKRGSSRTLKTPWYNLVINEDTEARLKEQKLSFSSVPREGRRVFLQKDPFLKFGSDPIDKTAMTHPDNKELLIKIARLFDARLVGIDFLVPDISESFKNQNCAILELNSLPGIIGHHFPFRGSSQDVTKAVLDLFFKYYL